VADANLVCDQYHLGIGLRLAASEVIAELIDAGVIKETAGNYRFSYPYYFHYFVARYLRDRRRDGESDPLVGAEVRKQVAFMADRVYFEEYSNILVFYLYLTKDICLIDHILTNAQQFFSDCAPCSLEADIEEINNLSLAQPLQAVLPCDDVNKNRYDLRERLDEIGSPLPRKRPRANAWSTATTWTI
jgi:hypothetical protein